MADKSRPTMSVAEQRKKEIVAQMDGDNAAKAKTAREMLKSDALTTDKDSPKFAEMRDFEFHGQKYQVRSDAMLDIEVIEWFTDMETAGPTAIGYLVRVIRKILGPGQWEQFKHPDGRDVQSIEEDGYLDGFFEALKEALDPTQP